MISFQVRGSSSKTEAWLRKMSKLDIMSILQSGAKDGVRALESATPTDSRLASNSWGYEITAVRGVYTISWTNKDIENGFPVAIMLQYGYGTGTGGYVQGRDYINPAMKPIFDAISDKVWKAVTSA